MNKWRKSRIINRQRIPAIEEAIDLYLQGKYYGCSSILACQISGMVGDLFTYHEEDEEWIEKVNLAYEYMRESDDLKK